MQYQPQRSAVLLVNLGSPEAPTSVALKRYLAEFLSDRRVIDLSRWLWWPILHGFVLRTRPQKSALLYQKIWWPEGAPLLVISEQQVAGIRACLAEQGLGDVIVDYAMRYGSPSISDKLWALKAQGVDQILVLPMYPQYCDATTASVLDAVGQAFSKMRYVPEWRFVHHWHDDADYIAALAETYHQYARVNGEPQRLLLSFHGTPKRYLEEGDPYFCHCHKTTRLLREKLRLPEDKVLMVFQSRFGREQWLRPYADETLLALPKQGIKRVAVMCPGFTADCLETLEEMAQANRDLFLAAGGEQYHYIPALNAEAAHIKLLTNLIERHTEGWMRFRAPLNMAKQAAEVADTHMNSWREDKLL